MKIEKIGSEEVETSSKSVVDKERQSEKFKSHKCYGLALSLDAMHDDLVKHKVKNEKPKLYDLTSSPDSKSKVNANTLRNRSLTPEPDAYVVNEEKANNQAIMKDKETNSTPVEKEEELKHTYVRMVEEINNKPAVKSEEISSEPVKSDETRSKPEFNEISHQCVKEEEAWSEPEVDEEMQLEEF